MQVKYFGVLRDFVEAVVARCPSCAKTDQRKITGSDRLQPIKSEEFLERVQIDLKDFDGYRSEMGYRYCMSIIDHYTSFVQVYPLRTKEMSGTWNHFRSFCLTFGCPQIVHTDNGTEFALCVSNMFDDIDLSRISRNAENYGYEMVNGAPYHAESQGKVERWNGTITRWMASVNDATKGQMEWLERVQVMASDLNNPPHGVNGGQRTLN